MRKRRRQEGKRSSWRPVCLTELRRGKATNCLSGTVASRSGCLFVLTLLVASLFVAALLVQHVIVLFQPGSYLRPEFFLRAATHHNTDVTDRKHKVALIIATNQIGQRQAGLRVDYIIVLTQDVEYGASDPLQVNHLAADLEPSLREKVVLKEVVGQLTADLPGQRYIAVHPVLKQLEHLGIPLAILMPV